MLTKRCAGSFWRFGSQRSSVNSSVIVQCGLRVMQARSRMLWYWRWRRRSLYSRVMSRPFRVHLLQSLQRLHSLIDRTTKSCAILVVEQLVDMAGEYPPLILRRGIAFTRPNGSMGGSEAIGCRSWVPHVLIACYAPTIAGVIVQ